jgi:glutamine synthetase adenylyltransferase
MSNAMPNEEAPPTILDAGCDPIEFETWLRANSIPTSAAASLKRISQLELGPDQRRLVADRLALGLSGCADPSMAVLNLERFLISCPERELLFRILRRKARAFESLLLLFGTSQYLSDLLIGDPLVIEWLVSGPDRHDRQGLFELLWTRLVSQRTILRRFARFATARSYESATTTSFAARLWKWLLKTYHIWPTRALKPLVDWHVHAQLSGMVKHGATTAGRCASWFSPWVNWAERNSITAPISIWCFYMNVKG